MKNIHLKEDQIFHCVVDEESSPREIRRHIEKCPVCQKKKASLASELEHLGKMAGDFVPTPIKKPVLSLKEPGVKRFRLPVFATGLATGLLVAFLVGAPLYLTMQKQAKSDLTFINEVHTNIVEDMLVEPALYEHYLDITSPSYSFFDDEFLDFMAPVEEQIDSSEGVLHLTFRA